MPYRSDPSLWFNLPGVIAAWQPVACPAGALAARINVSNEQRTPTRYAAAPGVAPTFGAATGWTLNGSTQYLTTGILPNEAFSLLVRCSGLSGTSAMGIAGCKDAESPLRAYRIYPVLDDTLSAFQMINQTAVAARTTAGVVGIVGKSYYIGGALSAFSAPWPSEYTWTHDIWLGAINSVGLPESFSNGAIQAALVCEHTLTASHVWLASRQMAYCDRNPDWSAWGRRRRYYYAPSEAAAAGAARQAMHYRRLRA